MSNAGLSFPGKDKLVAAVSAVAHGDCEHTIGERLQSVLTELVHDPAIQLPELLFNNTTDQYLRRLLHHDPVLDYTIMAMSWGPGQATPIHDHNGMWCVEAVWRGEIEVVQYELLVDQGDRVQMRRHQTIAAEIGSAGSLIPPHEYHTIANPSATDTAVTLHIYQGALDQCCLFHPTESAAAKTGEAQWYLRETKQLSLDAA
jgi:predicted metal-dependent enzyme (double-stranded beta helix superfamily)